MLCAPSCVAWDYWIAQLGEEKDYGADSYTLVLRVVIEDAIGKGQ